VRHVALLALLLLGCAVFEGVTPDIRITGRTMLCANATRTSNYITADYQAYTCTWDCAHYAGQSRIYVQLTYVWTGAAWALDSTFTDAGICGASYDRSPVGV
jgi:hypothetical protein